MRFRTVGRGHHFRGKGLGPRHEEGPLPAQPGSPRGGPAVATHLPGLRAPRTSRERGQPTGPWGLGGGGWGAPGNRADTCPLFPWAQRGMLRTLGTSAEG